MRLPAMQFAGHHGSCRRRGRPPRARKNNKRTETSIRWTTRQGTTVSNDQPATRFQSSHSPIARGTDPNHSKNVGMIVQYHKWRGPNIPYSNRSELTKVTSSHSAGAMSQRKTAKPVLAGCSLISTLSFPLRGLQTKARPQMRSPSSGSGTTVQVRCLGTS